MAASFPESVGTRSLMRCMRVLHLVRLLSTNDNPGNRSALFLAGGAPPPPARVGPHPHAKSGPPARRFLAAPGWLTTDGFSNPVASYQQPAGGRASVSEQRLG